MTEKTVTLITGTRKGIGKHLCGHYLAQGHVVVGCSRETPEWAAENYHHHTADVSNEKQVQEIFKFISGQFGRLDHLINNAGIASMNHSLLTSLETVHKIMNTNFVGTFLFSREAARLMQKRKNGRIINFSTVATPLKLEGEAVYAASKAAVVSLTQVLARELAGYGITVNALGPTPIETDLVKSVPKQKLQDLINQQAIKRMGTFEDVTNVTDFFLREQSRFITGQVLYLGGV